ncbi:MAG: FAD:protein FMN transferase, partial [Gammaproteobacteria bacterium]|nr:FAD:protein FMN transferase [Gammaproteobacteria bacterium]
MPKTNLHFITFLFVFLTHTPAYAEWYKANKAIMGTAINVELWHDNKKIAEANIQRVFDEMHRIDRLMSPYKQNSEVSLINANASNHPLKISSELFELIKKSINISKLSNGAFDITFASVGYMYDYRKKQQPTKEEISKRLKSINYQNIKLDSSMQSIFFTQANTRIDLGGIAKGHAVDNAIKLLQQHGIKQAMISAGGDTRIIGDKNGRPWYVGIRHPRNKNKSAVILPLNNTAIST